MRKSRFTEAQMVAIQREADKGPVAEVAKNQYWRDVIYNGDNGLGLLGENVNGND